MIQLICPFTNLAFIFPYPSTSVTSINGLIPKSPCISPWQSCSYRPLKSWSYWPRIPWFLNKNKSYAWFPFPFPGGAVFRWISGKAPYALQPSLLFVGIGRIVFVWNCPLQSSVYLLRIKVYPGNLFAFSCFIFILGFIFLINEKRDFLILIFFNLLIG